jgi:hypothetical protein
MTASITVPNPIANISHQMLGTNIGLFSLPGRFVAG